MHENENNGGDTDPRITAETPTERSGTFFTPLMPQTIEIDGTKTIRKVSERYGADIDLFTGKPREVVTAECWELSANGTTTRILVDAGTRAVTGADLWDALKQFLTFTDAEHEEITKFNLMYQIDGDPTNAADEYARHIYESGRALDFLCESCRRVHVGDSPAIRTMFLSYAATRVTNGDGIHISISGDAGTGKSHACMTVARRLPEHAIITDRLSDKSLFYHEIPERTVILMDDQELTPDFMELLKVASTYWNLPANYRTVQNGKAVTLSIAARCPFWICKANLNGDEQILDRQLLFWTDTSEEQRRAVQEALMRAAQGLEETDESGDLVICRAIWNFIPCAEVVAPFADRIKCSEQLDPRNIKLMIAMIRAAALMDASNRRRDRHNRVIAEIKDYETAAAIMNPILQNKGGSQKLKLSAAAASVLEYLAAQNKPLIQFADVRRATGLSQAQLSQALYGRKDCEWSGLMAICPAIEVVNLSESESDGDTATAKRKSITRRAIKWGVETYKTWNVSNFGFYLEAEKENGGDRCTPTE